MALWDKITTTIAGMGLTAAMASCVSADDNSCQYDADCSSGEICSVEECIPEGECRVDSDCPGLDVICEDNRCVGDSFDGDIETARNVRILEDLNNYRSVEVDRHESIRGVFINLDIEFSDDNHPQINDGDFIAGTADGGYLMQVDGGARSMGNILHVGGDAVPLEQVIRNGQIDESFSLSDPGNFKSSNDFETRRSALGFRRDFSGEVLYQGSVGSESLTVRITEGYLDMQSDINLDATFSNFRLTEASLIANTTTEFYLDVSVDGSGAVAFSDEIRFGGYIQPVIFYAGPVPVVVTFGVGVDVGFSVDVDANGQISTGFDCDSNLEAGAVNRQGRWQNVWDSNIQCDGHGADFNMEGNSQIVAYVSTFAEAKIYQTGASSIGYKNGLRFIGGLDTSSWGWELSSFNIADINFDLSVLGHSLASHTERLRGGEEVIASDSSEGTGCDYECDEGAARCFGNDVELCQLIDGCYGWDVEETCRSGQYCEDAECVDDGPGCTDDCDTIGNYCSGDRLYQCGSFDGDSCNDRRLIETCDDGCSDGECNDDGPSCTNDCPSIGDYCSGDRLKECGYFDSDSCRDSRLITICEYGCSGGECNDTPSCRDHRACDDGVGNICIPIDALYECGYFDEDSCIDLRFVEFCTEGCSDGECVDASTGRFVDLRDGAVWDSHGGGTYTRIPQSLTFNEAISYCNDLVLHGSDRWAVPQAMSGLRDSSLDSCSLDPIFGASCGTFWVNWNFCSGEPGTQQAYDFGTNATLCTDVDSVNYVLCVIPFD